MMMNWRAGALRAISAAMVLCQALVAVGQSPEEILVDVTLRDADLLTATRMLTERTGLQFVIEPSSEPFAKITLQLTRQPADQAIRYICQAAGAFFRRDENGVYIISRTKPAEPPVKESEKSRAKAVSVFRRIRLQKADARDVWEQVLNVNPYDSTRRFQELNRFNNTVNPPAFTNEAARNPINLTPETYQPVPVRRFQSPRTGTEAANDIRVPGEAANYQDIGGGGGLGGGQGFGQGAGQGFGQQTGPTGQALSGGFVPQGIDVFSFDPTDNSLVVQGTEEAINALQRIISEFDRAPKQVLIKVEFVTTTTNLNRSIGYDFLYQRGTIFFGVEPGTFARAGDPFFLSYSTGNVSTRLRANLSEGRGRVVQAPIVRTLNNQPASVSSSVSTTIFLTQIQNAGGGVVITTSTPVSLQVNTGLSVTPRINNDNTITMFLAPTVQDFGQIRRGPQGQEIPDIVRQSVAVVARVKNGETIALGGLNRRDDLGTMVKYPILGDLPIIGQFFRSETRNKNNQELLIFVTPTIIEDEDVGGLGP